MQTEPQSQPQFGQWLKPADIAHFPELHSTPMNIIRLLVWLDIYPHSFIGWFNPAHNGWHIDGSPTGWILEAWMPMLGKPSGLNKENGL